MTDISEQDEREAREWLRNADCGAHGYAERAKHRATILALLDRPRTTMPTPDEVPNEVIARMNGIHAEMSMRAAIQVLYDWRTKPAEPEIYYLVKFSSGGCALAETQKQAQRVCENSPGSRIVHLVEADRD